MAQSLFQVLERNQPNINIEVLAPIWSEGLLQRMPEVYRVIPHSIGHGQLAWGERRRMARQLHSRNYQQAIVLPNSWKSALIPYWAKIPCRTGYLGEKRYGLLNDIRKPNKLLLRKTVEQFAALGLPPKDPRIGQLVPKPRLLPKQVTPTLQRLELKPPPPFILALCPGAEYGPAKHWPLEHYATVAQAKIAQGWQVWIFGSDKDISLGARIQNLVGEDSCINLCGQTSLPDAIDLLSLAHAVITNDSGLLHVAAALDKLTIAIYGSSSPGMTPPLSSNAHTIYLGLKCSPCYQRTCPKKHLKCLRNITPEQVLNMLDSYTQEQKILTVGKEIVNYKNAA